MAGSNRRGIARVACVLGLTTAMTLGGLPLAAQPALAGTLTINAAEGNTGMTYDAYQLFTGSVTADSEGARTISSVKWNEAARSTVLDVLGTDYHGSTAQDAADYIASKIGGTTSESIVDSGSFADELAGALAKSGIAATQLTAGTAKDDLADGYYIVVSHAGALEGHKAATAPVFTLVGSGNAAVTINEKASVPTLDKQVREDSTGEYGHTADANRGQAVSYRLTATLPKNLASYQAYHLKFVDYLSAGLDYGKDAKVSVLHDDGTTEVLGGSSQVKVTCPYTGDDAKDGMGDAEQTVLAVDVADLRGIEMTGGESIVPTDKIVVDYTATLNGKAAIGSTGNPNKAKLIYSNDPRSSGTGTTELVDPLVFTYQLNVHKRDKDKESAGTADTGLAGARFTLQVKEADGTADAGSKGKYVQGDGSLGEGEHEFVSDDKGNVAIPRIDAGTYDLVETAAPAGYNRMEGPATITITSNREADSTFLVRATGTGNDAAKLETAADKTTGQIDVTVRDTKNVGMPQTGSAGFAAMIAGGGSLVAVSLAALLRRRR